MEIYTVSFFGHRRISQPLLVEKRLDKIVRKLIKTKEYVEFLVGRDGDFDILAASVIRRAVKALDYGNTSLILVLPRMTAEYRDNEESFREYYDDVEICTEAEKAHFKGAFQVRNRIMADRSDLIVCCIEHESGGAFQTVRYAEKKKKKTMNISQNTKE